MTEQLEGRVDSLYRHRFPSVLLARRAAVWKVICRHWLEHYMAPNGSVLEIAAGYCEFINNVSAKERVAIDLNPETRMHAAPNVTVHLVSAEKMAEVLPAEHFDTVFMSNFLEHCRSREQVMQVLEATASVLKPSGRVLILGPNFRVCPGPYFDFFDHMLPLTERSVTEALHLAGFEVEEATPRTLPLTFRSNIPSWPWLVATYLHMPWVWRWFGAQFLVVGRRAKDGSASTRNSRQ